MPTTFMDRPTFLANLRQSGLVEPAQLEEVLLLLSDTNRGRVIAREMVARGLLTKFQAEMLLAGRTGGFQLGQYRILDQLGQECGIGLVESLPCGRRAAFPPETWSGALGQPFRGQSRAPGSCPTRAARPLPAAQAPPTRFGAGSPETSADP